MYFGSPVAGPFTVGDSVFRSLILCLKVKNKQKKKNQSRGHFLAPLKPDAVLHSLKPQSTLQRGRHETIKAASLGGKKKNASRGHRESPLLLSTQPHYPTKQYWSHWSRTVLVIALPNRFEWKDMEAYYFGSVCDSMGTLLGRVIF